MICCVVPYDNVDWQMLRYYVSSVLYKKNNFQALRREIEQRLDRVAEIYYEPKLLTLEIDNQANTELSPYYFRMKAVDNMKYLGKFSFG